MSQKTIIDLVLQDHRTVDSLFDQFNTATSDQLRLQFGNDLIRELSVHAAVEEQILYPTLKTVLNDEPDTTKSLSEHQDMKEILEKMRNTQPSDPEYRQLANQAKLCVHKHVQYEESQILPMFQSRLEKDHLVRLGEFWEQAKKTAPTLPHPGAPNTAPANIFTGPLLAFFDKIKETVAGGAQHAPQQPAS